MAWSPKSFGGQRRKRGGAMGRDRSFSGKLMNRRHKQGAGSTASKYRAQAAGQSIVNKEGPSMVG